jgi:hypothetical protein
MILVLVDKARKPLEPTIELTFVSHYFALIARFRRLFEAIGAIFAACVSAAVRSARSLAMLFLTATPWAAYSARTFAPASAASHLRSWSSLDFGDGFVFIRSIYELYSDMPSHFLDFS